MTAAERAELEREVRAIIEASLNAPVVSRWTAFVTEVNERVRKGTPVDVAQRACDEARERLLRELEALDVPTVESWADLERLEHALAVGAEELVRRARFYANHEIARWAVGA